MNKIVLSLFLVFALIGTAWANSGWYSTLQGTASDVEQTPPPNGVTIAYNTTDHEWEFNYGLAPSGGTTGTCLEKNSNSDYDYSWVTCSGSGGSGTVSSGTVGQEAVYTGTTTVGSGIITDNGTNVGIGSTAPGQILDIQGTVRASLGIYQGTQPVCLQNGTNCPSAGSGTVTSITAQSPLSGGTITTTGNIGIGTALGSISTFGTSGNVGINSTAPGQVLDVQGTIRATTINGTTAVQVNGTNVLTSVSANSPLSGSGTAGSPLVFTNPGYITLSSLSNTIPITYNNSTGAIGINTTGTWNGNAVTSTNSTTTSQIGTLTNTDWCTSNGSTVACTTSAPITTLSPITLVSPNVGIGSTAPGQVLDVQGTVRDLGENITGLTASQITATDASKNLQSLTTATYPSLTELSYVKGVTSAIQTQINAKGSGTVTSVVAGAGLTGGTISTTGTIAIDLTNANTWTGQQIFNTANVGINSATPGQSLDVQGTVRTTGFTLSGNNAASGFILQTNGSLGIGTWVPAPSGGGSGTVNSGTTGQVGYYASSTTAISGSSAITVTGASSGNNIGIGSATPGSLLDVQGTVRILNGGNIGIGTSTVSQSLFVQGNAFSLNALYGTETFATASSITCTGNYKYCYMANTQGVATFTVNAPTNAYLNGQTLVLKMSSTSVQTFSWASGGGGFVGGNVGLPTTSDATGNIQVFVFMYDSVHSHWEYMGTGGGFT